VQVGGGAEGGRDEGWVGGWMVGSEMVLVRHCRSEIGWRLPGAEGAMLGNSIHFFVGAICQPWHRVWMGLVVGGRHGSGAS
jgi:hypothetical protein